jgi:hypothetical protein
MAGCCCQLQHCNIWHILGRHGHAHARMNSTCSSIPCLCISIVRTESSAHNLCTIAWVGPVDSGVVYHWHLVHWSPMATVATLHAVLSTALHASDWQRGSGVVLFVCKRASHKWCRWVCSTMPVLCLWQSYCCCCYSTHYMCTVLIPTGWAHVYPAVHDICECMVNLFMWHCIVYANSAVCMKLSVLTHIGAVAAVAVFSSAGTMLIIPHS